jgi:hypothetical protein
VGHRFPLSTVASTPSPASSANAVWRAAPQRVLAARIALPASAVKRQRQRIGLPGARLGW